MQDYAWNVRKATSSHHQWFRNLADMHELTTGWVNAVRGAGISAADKNSYFLTRGLSAEVAENLWMLEPLSDLQLEGLLDDTRPQDALGRLERTVWAVQAWTLRGLIEKARRQSVAALQAVLEQVAWQTGRKHAQQRWGTVYGGRLKGQLADLVSDLRALRVAMIQSPFSGYPEKGPLVRRAVSDEIELELFSCAHRNYGEETSSVADDLCRLHTHWARGFGYELNNKVSVELKIGGPEASVKSGGRCVQRWFIVVA